MRWNRRPFEEELAELFKRASTDEDFEVAEHLLLALKVITHRGARTVDLIDHLCHFPNTDDER